ncbi:MAG: helix-turn-helix transcriptional regulator [Actinomycetota bacterium]|nr:helix-turn-helix transcriptional regulator [Actinomycetota bacterium]
MVKMSELRSAEDIAAGELRDPEVRREYERTAFANAVAIRVIRYRAEHGLSQSALARQLGMSQPAIARLEAGEHEPSLGTLARLAGGLAIDFSVEITPTALGLRDTA